MSLWRTARPRFSMYVPNGLGRDYYITYNNAGLWENIRIPPPAPDYERPRYNNFHTLIHKTSPVKYYASGYGRETYILNSLGMVKDEKPMCNYQLTDFLRSNKRNAYSKKNYMSFNEKKYNSQLHAIEKRVIERLYTNPEKKRKMKKEENNENLENLEEFSKNGEIKNFNFMPKTDRESITDEKNNRYESENSKTLKTSSFPLIKKLNKSVDRNIRKFKFFETNTDILNRQSQEIQEYEFRTKYKIKEKIKSRSNFNNNQNLLSKIKIKKKVGFPIKEEDKNIYLIKTQRDNGRYKQNNLNNIFTNKIDGDKVSE